MKLRSAEASFENVWPRQCRLTRRRIEKPYFRYLIFAALQERQKKKTSTKASRGSATSGRDELSDDDVLLFFAGLFRVHYLLLLQRRGEWREHSCALTPCSCSDETQLDTISCCYKLQTESCTDIKLLLFHTKVPPLFSS